MLPCVCTFWGLCSGFVHQNKVSSAFMQKGLCLLQWKCGEEGDSTHISGDVSVHLPFSFILFWIKNKSCFWQAATGDFNQSTQVCMCCTSTWDTLASPWNKWRFLWSMKSELRSVELQSGCLVRDVSEKFGYLVMQSAQESCAWAALGYCVQVLSCLVLSIPPPCLVWSLVQHHEIN